MVRTAFATTPPVVVVGEGLNCLGIVRSLGGMGIRVWAVTASRRSAVGWSRLRDDKHWMSDVVAGAGLGTWTARKVVQLARRAIR